MLTQDLKNFQVHRLNMVQKEKKKSIETSLIAKFRKNLEGLRSERDKSWLPHWKELNMYIEPKTGKFLVSDVNNGAKKDQKIYNGRGRLALRTLTSGMMSGTTSPSRPWFNLKVGEALMQNISVRRWLDEVEQSIYSSFARSNLYTELPKLYKSMALYGIGAMMALEDYQDVTRFYTFSVGEFFVANDERLKVGTYQLSVQQVVDEFEWENVSDDVKRKYNSNNLYEKIDIVHMVQRNDDRDPDAKDNKNMMYRSVHFEKNRKEGDGKGKDGFLKESGFKRFPLFCPRWEVESTDDYGTGPGFDALADVKQLQIEQKRKLQSIDRMANPPVVAPSTMIGKNTSTLPGGVTYSDERDSGKGIRALYQVDPRINELMLDIRETEGRINEIFFADLFLMLSQTDRREITAREIAERHEEKLLALGPVLERLNDELLDDLVTMQFERMYEGGLLPKAPPELQGTSVKIEYISVLHQAQRSVGISAIDQLMNFAGAMAKISPGVLDKINGDKTLDKYSEYLGTPASILNSDEEVQGIRSQRAQQEQAQSQGQAGLVASEIGKNLSATDLDKNNALKAVVGKLAQSQQ